MIDTDEKLAALLPELRAASWIALDTEADSLHAYPEKLCLIQISTVAGDRLLDPLAPMKLAPVLELLRTHELILHGADYDLRLLRKTWSFQPTMIFDTMIAARLLGERQFGLVHLVAKFLGVTLEKGPQKANWARRPLTPRMEDYARNDTHSLKPLSDLLRQQLQEKGRLAWQQQTCTRLIADCAETSPPDPDTVWRVKGSHHLGPAGLGVLREMFYWREHEAMQANTPPFFILQHDTMVKLAAAAEAARAVEDLLPARMRPWRKTGLLQAIQRGLEEKNPPRPLRHRGQRQTEAEKRRLDELEKRRDRQAQVLNLDATLIASRAVLVLLARDWDQHQSELLPWQKELLEK